MLEAPVSIEAYVKVPPYSGRSIRIRLVKENIRKWNDRLKIMIHDPYISVYVDKKSTRVVPVKDVLQGTPAQGFFTKKVKLSPRTIQVTGLKSDLLKLREVTTEPIDITGVQKNTKFEASLIPPIGLSRDNLSVEQVSVMLEVEEKHENRRYTSIPIEVLEGSYTHTIRPLYVSIVIQATESVLNFIKRDDLKAFIDIRERKPGRYEENIKVKIPPDTVLIENSPENAIVTIHNRKKN